MSDKEGIKVKTKQTKWVKEQNSVRSDAKAKCRLFCHGSQPRLQGGSERIDKTET
jgi:hypothetical protein